MLPNIKLYKEYVAFHLEQIYEGKAVFHHLLPSVCHPPPAPIIKSISHLWTLGEEPDEWLLRIRNNILLYFDHTKNVHLQLWEQFDTADCALEKAVILTLQWGKTESE